MREKSVNFEEVGKTKCAVCNRGNYQSSTERLAVYDAYCVACRGLFRFYTRTKGLSEGQAKQRLLNQFQKNLGVKTGRMRSDQPNLSVKPREIIL